MNQPLQIISGYCELIIKDIPDDHSLNANVKIIQEQIDKMGAITRKMVMIRKYETKPDTKGTIIIDIDKSSDTIT